MAVKFWREKQAWIWPSFRRLLYYAMAVFNIAL